MKPITIGILLYDSGGAPRNVFTEDKYRLLAERMTMAGWQVKTLGYHDDRQEAVRSAALQCDALLVWINPIEPGLNRATLDLFLRELAETGLLVSAHPDAILRIGTKDVLVSTQALGWSIDACAYRSLEEFKTRFPAQVKRDGIRVLKQYRGHSGNGVWKITAGAAGTYEVRPAARDATGELMPEARLLAHFDSEVFARGSHLIDQRWVPTLPRGMVRAYLCGAKVAGFGYQEINALYPAAPDEDFTRQQPSRRHYYTGQCHLFQGLRQRLEGEWVPGLCACAGIGLQELPLLWDADFLLGNPPREYLLCEINASCVSPFPDSAITPLLKEITRRLAARLDNPRS
jgi:hypothetical protein